MKIKLSKSQWEEAGKKAGWIKKAQVAPQVAPQAAPQATQQADPTKSPQFQQAIQLWQSNRQDEAVKLLQSIDPNITKEIIQQIMQQKQQKQAGSKSLTIKTSNMTSWLANVFVLSVLAVASFDGKPVPAEDGPVNTNPIVQTQSVSGPPLQGA